MRYTINKDQIVEMYAVPMKDYAASDTWAHLMVYKGEKYGWPFKKTAKEDMFRIFLENKYITRSQLNDRYIKEISERDTGNQVTFVDGVLYYKPRVIIKMSNQISHVKFFETYDEAESFIEDFRNNHNNFQEIEI